LPAEELHTSPPPSIATDSDARRRAAGFLPGKAIARRNFTKNLPRRANMRPGKYFG